MTFLGDKCLPKPCRNLSIASATISKGQTETVQHILNQCSTLNIADSLISYPHILLGLTQSPVFTSTLVFVKSVVISLGTSTEMTKLSR